MWSNWRMCPSASRGKSKALTCEQVDDVLFGTTADWLHPYIVVSLLTGTRTEELRAMRWDHVQLDGVPDA
jgi:hypothetical protein